jgi:uncharacterized protein YqgQ
VQEHFKGLYAAGYDPGNVLEACKAFNEELFGHFKYMNNYQYQKAIRQMNLTPYYDNGMMIMVEDEQYASPIAVVNYEFLRMLPHWNKSFFVTKK